MEQAHYSIPIIYQDHHLLIVNKPAGLVIHPTYKHATGTMWDALLLYLAEQGGDNWSPPVLPDEPGWQQAPEHVRQMLRGRRLEKLSLEEGLLPRPALLHRLDKDTSGVVALARTMKSRRHVVRQFSEHTIVKTYLAVAQHATPAWTQPRVPLAVSCLTSDGVGERLSWPPDLTRYAGRTLLLDGPLRRDPDDRRRCIVGPDGQEARTQITVLAEQDDFLLVEAQPITGRTHQIRAHLAAVGYALVGDPTYAPLSIPGSPAGALERQFLHAFSLTFRDYPDNHLCRFVAPLPSELLTWVAEHFLAARDVIEARTNALAGSGPML